jgi:hypothetical protein
MPGARPSLERVQQGQTRDARADARALSDELKQLQAMKQFEDDCKEWCKKLGSAGGKEHFHIRQFFCQGDENFGGNWQKYICRRLKVPEEQWQSFWERQDSRGGKKAAKIMISTRRTNATAAIKQKFEGKWTSAGHLKLPQHLTECSHVCLHLNKTQNFTGRVSTCPLRLPFWGTSMSTQNP